MGAHIPNLPRPNKHVGVSDLHDVVNLNRAPNERMSDQADTIRYHADPPVIFKGVSEHTDLAVWPTRLRLHDAGCGILAEQLWPKLNPEVLTASGTPAWMLR